MYLIKNIPIVICADKFNYGGHLNSKCPQAFLNHINSHTHTHKLNMYQNNRYNLDTYSLNQPITETIRPCYRLKSGQLLFYHIRIISQL